MSNVEDKLEQLYKELKEKGHCVEIIKQYLNMAYCLGYDRGFGKGKKQRRLKALNQFGVIKHRFPSVEEAADYFKVNKRYIRKAILEGWRCKGFIIMLDEDE